MLYGTLLGLMGYLKVDSARFVLQCWWKHWPWCCKIDKFAFFKQQGGKHPIKRAAGCSQRQRERDTDALTFLAGAWDEGSLNPAWRGDPGPRGAAHHEQSAADRQDAAGEPEHLCVPAYPGAAQPRRGGEWLGGCSVGAAAAVLFC